MPKEATFSHKIRNFLRTRPIWSIVIVLVIIAVSYFLFRGKKVDYQFIKVTKGSIEETVSVTGNTVPVASVSLGFGSSGTISKISKSVGDKVYAGEILAELNSNDLLAQLRQAQADVDTEIARLEGLKAGSKPEDIASAQASLDKAKQDLNNMYASIVDVSSEALASANDAVRTQLSALFSNAETQSPQITFNSSDSQAAITSQTKRFLASSNLSKWQTELLGIGSVSGKVLESYLNKGVDHLNSVKDLLASVSLVLYSPNSLDATTLATYKTNLITAFGEVNTATKNINTLAQDIASQKLTVAKYEADLASKKSGSTAQDISAAEAQVAQAKASVAVVQAKFLNSRIVAPISGVINQFDVKVGQTATANAPLVSIIGTGGFEIHAGVSETDIGKLAIGNKVKMTLDAFQNESFDGTVFYIAPAETNSSGVINYQIKVSFDRPDTRVKSGLTANLTIYTRRKDEVMILPQYAILQNDDGNFVQVLENNKIKNLPVVLGLQDQDGNVEVVSGVTQDQEVLNVGLKKN